MKSNSSTKIQLFHTTYEIASSKEDVSALIQAAKTLEQQLMDLHGKDNRNPPHIEKLAVTNCLNLIHDVNRLNNLLAELTDRTTGLVQKIETGESLGLKR